MLLFLPAPILGTIMLVLLIVNTVFWAIPVYVFIFVKLLVPKGSKARDGVSRLVAWLAQQWAMVDILAVDTLLGVKWDIRMNAQVTPRGQYLVCSNHQSWNDILVLMKAFGRRAPFFKFFIKQVLIWVPVLGLCWWGLDYPFMKRYSKEQIEKNPQLKGKDLDTTRKACEAFRNQPALILNFLEGTRFRPWKHEKQNSPYRRLLRPKSGGFAFTLSVLGERLDSLLDVTIVYPEGAKGFWDFLCGRVRHVMVDVRPFTIPAELMTGDYENDPEVRRKFQQQVSALWEEKDARIAQMLAEAGL